MEELKFNLGDLVKITNHNGNLDAEGVGGVAVICGFDSLLSDSTREAYSAIAVTGFDKPVSVIVYDDEVEAFNGSLKVEVVE